MYFWKLILCLQRKTWEKFFKSQLLFGGKCFRLIHEYKGLARRNCNSNQLFPTLSFPLSTFQFNFTTRTWSCASCASCARAQQAKNVQAHISQTTTVQSYIKNNPTGETHGIHLNPTSFLFKTCWHLPECTFFVNPLTTKYHKNTHVK